MNDEWKNNLRQQMEDYVEQPPKDLFNDAMAEMYRRRHHKRIISVATLAAAAVATLLLVNVLTTNTERNDSTIAKQTSTKAIRHSDDTNEIPNGKEATTSNIIANIKSTIHDDITAAQTIAGNMSEDARIDTSANETQQATEEKQTTNQDKDKRYKIFKRRRQMPNANNSHTGNGMLLAMNSPKSTGGISVGMNVSGGIFGKNNSNGSTPALMQMDAIRAEMGTEQDYALVMGRESRQPEFHAHHRQPVKVGVSVALPLSSRWSVSTGIFYSYHSSDIDVSLDNQSYTIDQKLHFLGIPLNANYKVYENKRFKIYTSAGGAAEKMVSGKQTTEGVKNDVKMNKLQWSANTHVGAEYKATDKIGIYVEPGASYYFNNHSGVKTIYGDHPWNAELNLGLRFNLK